MRCRVKSHNERNPRRQLPARDGGDSGGTAGASREEGGDDVKSARPPRPGRHTCYSGRHSGPPPREGARIPKAGPGSDRGLQPDPVKLDSLVIAHQPRRGEYVPGPCTHRPSSHGSRGRLKPAPGRGGRGRARRLGLSRNKVAVPEGAAGTPPFWWRAPAGAAGPRIAIPSRAAARGAGESRSSAGQSATLIMWRPPVQIRAGLRPGGRGGISSVGRAPALQAGGRRFEPGILHRSRMRHRSLARRAGRAGPPEGPAPPGRGREERNGRRARGRAPRRAPAGRRARPARGRRRRPGGRGRAARARGKRRQGARRMPRLPEAMKDALSCENPGRGAQGP